MNERLKNITADAKDKWSRWKPLQKAIAAGIIVVVIIAVFFLVRGSSKSADVRLFNSAISDQDVLDSISFRLDEANVKYHVQDGIIYVSDDKIARKWRPQLVTEGLVPNNLNAYSVFGETDWTRNDFDDEVKWLQAMETRLRDNLRQIDGILDATVNLNFPKESLYASNQKPVTASVTIKTAGTLERKAVQGINSLCLKSVEGLLQENLVILDGNGTVLNDFEGMAESDALTLREREQRLRTKWEAQYSSRVLDQLNAIFTDRVHVANMTVEMDFSSEVNDSTEYSGITIIPDNPDTVYDDSRVVDSLVVSEESIKKDYTGTAYNPEGIAGPEGQNPPVYSDAQNTIGKSTEEGVKRNYALNSKTSHTERKPEPGRRTISVNIDSKWMREIDSSGSYVVDENNRIKRTRVDLTPEELANARRIVCDAVGYNERRGDSVTVENIPNDHDKEFEQEDIAYMKKLQRNKTILLALIGVAVILVAFILFRIISREIERKRRLREEEALRRQREEREKALWEAKDSGMEVTMSVEERKRAELQESAIAMAKEHPEDVAMLIRTWLMEE